MQIIDLTETGAKIWRRFDESTYEWDPDVSPYGLPEDEIECAMLDTDFRSGSVTVPSYDPDAPDDPNRWCERNTPLVVHPEAGVWFVEVSSSDDVYPPLEEWRFESYYQSWMRIEEEFGWEKPPMAGILVFVYLDRADCIADFSTAPFDVYFRDDLARLPELLLERRLTESGEEVTSTLGALGEVAHPIPSVSMQLTCSPELARAKWGAGVLRDYGAAG